MTREIIAALTLLAVFLVGLAIFLCKLAFSGLRGKHDGRLSDQWEPDGERARAQKMRARSER